MTHTEVTSHIFDFRKRLLPTGARASRRIFLRFLLFLLIHICPARINEIAPSSNRSRCIHLDGMRSGPEWWQTVSYSYGRTHNMGCQSLISRTNDIDMGSSMKTDREPCLSRITWVTSKTYLYNLYCHVYFFRFLFVIQFIRRSCRKDLPISNRPHLRWVHIKRSLAFFNFIQV